MASRWPRFLLRLLIGHLVAYPVALPWAIGLVPFAIVWAGKELLQVDPADTSRVIRIVLHRLHVPGELAFAAAHLPCLYWAVASEARDRVARRTFIAGALGLAGLGVVFAVVSWVRFWRG